MCVALEYVFSSNFRILPQCFYFQSLTDIFPVYVYFYVKPNSWFLFLFHFTLMMYSHLVFGHTTQLLLNSLIIGCVYFAYLKGKKINVTASLNSKKFWFFPTNRINDLVYFSSHQLISNISSCMRKLQFTFKLNTSLFQFFYFFFHFLIACKKFLMRNCM